MPRLSPSLILIALVLTTAPHGYCWGETGHRAIARIAAAHLSPAARTAVSRLLGVADAPEAVADALADASLWADQVRRETNTGEWHYIDLTLQDKKKQMDERCPGENCVTARIALFAAQLSGKGHTGQWTDLDALRFLTHFVGDLHQPLHAISDADRGGNCEQVDPPFSGAKNLHAVWDSGLLAALDTDDHRLSASLNQYIDQLSRRKQKRLAKGDVRDWTWESHRLAETVIYQKLHIPVAPPEFPKSCGEAPAEITEFHPVVDGRYFNEMKPILRDQLMKAGVRLARLLNEAL